MPGEVVDERWRPNRTVELEQLIRESLGRFGRLSVPVDRLGADDDLFAAGLTSQSAVEVVFHLESVVGVELPDELIARDSVGTIARLASALRIAGADG